MEKTAQLIDAAGRPFVCEAPNEQAASEGVLANLKYLAVGTMFGIVFVKAEVVSWFRIQEMFRLQAFHMYGVIGTAVAVSMLSMFLIRTFKIRTLAGEQVIVRDKTFDKGQIYGGLIFGLGWALVFLSSFLINHFDLFGLRQIWFQLRRKPYEPLPFGTPVFYHYVRHPLYLGLLLAFWSTPTMTMTHLVFAIVTTLYILIAIQLEEYDLIAEHSEYAQYRRRVPMLVPFLKRRHGPPPQVARS